MKEMKDWLDEIAEQRSRDAKKIGVTPQLFGMMNAVGFAPGDYLKTCMYCETAVTHLDKSATTCRDCALEAIEVLGKEARKARIKAEGDK